ncbi:synaptic vesicle transporter [Microthyrium microscopicum]|uniref:Synaptic vesicle transporter n=1 Tax=Microthyrium microscopicum TaxID=703497 RepID=A0A6A6TVC8_9PEZI|nr:synaptic vesicle transporter [Microthyrium microscopicum]
MDSEPSRLGRLTVSRTRTRSSSRSLSHVIRPQQQRINTGTNFQKVVSAKSFDDHVAYSPPSATSEEGNSNDKEQGTTAFGLEQSEKKPHPTGDETSSTYSHTPESSPVDKDLEKNEPSNLQPEPSKDPFLVTWDGPNDPLNPKNWSGKRKWAATFVVSSFTFISPVSSSMVAPAMQAMKADLHLDSDFLASMILSIFVLAYAVGPLFLGPLSEVYGRVIVLQLSNLVYLVWNLACGFARTGPEMLVFRFLSGLGGSAPLAIGGAVLGDLFFAEQRGKAVSIYSLAPLLGPAIGPIAGGFVTANTTWRWIFYATTIADALIQVSGFFFLQETYVPILLQRKAAKLRKETGNDAYYTEFDHKNESLRQTLSTAAVRPFIMLFTQPIIQCIAFYMAYLYGLMYLMLSTFPQLWTVQYGFSTSIGSLHYIALGTGFFLGTQISAPINDRVYRRLKKSNNGVGRPEFRVPLMIAGSLFIPIGLFWYGWAAQAHTHWIVPDIGAAIFCAGTIVCFQSMQTYIVDGYTRYAASGIAAAVVLRSLAGFGFPLFAPSMYNALGFGWGNSLLAFVGIAIGVPAPIIFWKYGEQLRAKSKFASG